MAISGTLFLESFDWRFRDNPLLEISGKHIPHATPRRHYVHKFEKYYLDQVTIPDSKSVSVNLEQMEGSNV
jgi:hypothetical protein